MCGTGWTCRTCRAPRGRSRSRSGGGWGGGARGGRPPRGRAAIQEASPRLRLEGAYGRPSFVGFLMENMVVELVVAVLLTGLVVLLFLGNLRGTLISVITIPVSLGMALLAMVPLGMTLNRSTLMGLLISIRRLG